MSAQNSLKKNKVSIGYAFKTFILPRMNIILLGLLLIIISRLAGLVMPMATKYLMDDVIVNKDLVMLKWLIIIVAVSIFVNSVTSYALTQLLSVEAQRLISQLRVKVQKKILSLPISYFDNNKSGALVSRIMTDVEGVRNLVGTGLVQLIGGSFTSILSRP